jgi:hypothetical protein
MADLTNTLKWLSNYKPKLPQEPGSFIVQNCIQTPDGHILISSHRHDYKEYKDKNGRTYMVDGGVDYIRRSGYLDSTDLTVMSDDTFEDVRNKLLWGSYGKTGKDPLHWIRLKDMEENHIDNVMKMIENDGSEQAKWRRNMMMKELKYRKLKLIDKEGTI